MECISNDQLYFFQHLEEEHKHIIKNSVNIYIYNVGSVSKHPLHTSDIIPKYLKKLGYSAHAPFNYTLPKKLQSFRYDSFYPSKILLSSNVQDVMMSDNYDLYVETPKMVKKYRHGIHNSCPYNPSKHLEWLTIGHKYQTVIYLPKNLKHFILSKAYDQKIILPAYIEHITFIPCEIKYQKQIRLLLTENMHTIKNHAHNYFIKDNLPECLVEHVNYLNEID